MLALLVVEIKTKLTDTGLDCVPACEARGEMDVAGEAEVGWVEDFVGGWVVED